MASDAIDPAEVIDVEALMNYVNSDTSMLSELADIFRNYYPDHVKRLRSAVENGDSSTVREISHQLKGAVSNFFAVKAVEAARNLESAGRDNALEGTDKWLEILESEVERLIEVLNNMCNPV